MADNHTPSLPDDLRARGLMVAVHNDYRLHGQPMTFWLFVGPDGMSYKGEGLTDAEALDQVRAKLSAEVGGNVASDAVPSRAEIYSNLVDALRDLTTSVERFVEDAEDGRVQSLRDIGSDPAWNLATYIESANAALEDADRAERAAGG
jgi:hypothetical protein